MSIKPDKDGAYNRIYLWFDELYTWVPKFKWFKPPKNKWFRWAYIIVPGTYIEGVDAICEVWTTKWRSVCMIPSGIRWLFRWCYKIEVIIRRNRSKIYVCGDFNFIVSKFMEDIQFLSDERKFNALNEFMDELSKHDKTFDDIVKVYKRRSVHLMSRAFQIYQDSICNDNDKIIDTGITDKEESRNITWKEFNKIYNGNK